MPSQSFRLCKRKMMRFLRLRYLFDSEVEKLGGRPLTNGEYLGQHWTLAIFFRHTLLAERIVSGCCVMGGRRDRYELTCFAFLRSVENRILRWTDLGLPRSEVSWPKSDGFLTANRVFS